LTLFIFVLRRTTRHWQILLTLGLGVLLATAMLAAAPLLVNTVVELGLRRTLTAAQPADSNLRLVSTSFRPQEVAMYQQLDAQVEERLRRNLDRHLDQIIPSGGSFWGHPWVGDQVMADQRLNVRFYGRDNMHGRIEFLDGAWPDQTIVDDQTMAVVAGDEMARTYGLRVGDRLPFSYRPGDPAPSRWLLISGIARPLDPRQNYWFGELNPFLPQASENWSAQFSTFVPAADFLPAAGALFPEAGVELQWQALLDPVSITIADIEVIRGEVAALNGDLRRLARPVVLRTGVDPLLETFSRQAEIVRTPLYLLTSEIVLLALYYVVMVAALALRQVEREFAVLHSRGASRAQIFQIQAIEALFIGLVAFVSGPLLGVLLIRALALAGPLADVSREGLNLTITQTAWLAAAIGALACIAGLLLPTGSALQRTVVAQQQEAVRATQPAWWQRAYLDVFLLLGGLILLARLQLYGGVVAGGAAQPRADWLLLLAPLILLLGTGAILLRLFPLFLRFLAYLASRGRGLPAALALWQAARNPTHVARLVLLLTLAMALGILTTGLNATLDRSESERATYTAGSNLRLVSGRFVPVAEVQSLPGVTAVSGTWRGRATLAGSRRSIPFELLAIEPESMSQVIQYRPDFAEEMMPDLLARLAADEKRQLPLVALPGRPSAMGVWLWAPSDEEVLATDSANLRRQLLGLSDLDRVLLQVKLRTAQSEIITVRLNAPAPTLTEPSAGHPFPYPEDSYPEDGWRYFSTAVPLLPAHAYPISLHSVWVQNRAQHRNARYFGHTMQLALDDLTVIDGDSGATQIVPVFGELATVWLIDDPGSQAVFSTTKPHSGQSRTELTLRFSRGLENMGLRLASGYADPVLPLLVSQRFLQATQLAVGATTTIHVESQPMPFRIVGTVNYFPTMYEEMEGGFVITNSDLLLANLNRGGPTPVNVNEALVTTVDQAAATAVSQSAPALIPSLTRAWEMEELRATIKADPMALGLRSVTFFGYVLTTTLSLVGFATYFYMSARQREATFAVLRSLGLSPSQLYSALMLEQVVLILSGLALGTVLGVMLNQLTLPGLPITLGDRPPIPPFIAQNDWTAVGRIYLTLTIAFLLSLTIATWLLWRTQLHRLLRIGEE
jgi:ABC-type lipoprotein release transport system permease subunit